MAKKNTKKQLEAEAFEELRRKALEPFKTKLTKEEQLRHEKEIRERSISNMRKMREEISETDMQNIRSRADFEHHF